MNTIIIILGKIISSASRFLNLGEGATWPGQIALLLNPFFIKNVLDNSRTKVVLIAGTNGKTTTGKLVQNILEKEGKSVFQNSSGANLLNGIASNIVLHSSILSALNYDYAIFEIDENILSLILDQISPTYLILLNLFRDQLDRYGEVEIVAKKWQKAVHKLDRKTSLVLNADDPQIAYLKENTKAKVVFFGIDYLHSDASMHHATDSTYCPKCNSKLTYHQISYSHLGNWECDNCGFKRPRRDIAKSDYYPLPGTYNKYNTLAAVLTAKLININNETIEQSLRSFTPAFGRQEEIILEGKKVKLFLSKNPTSFNESLRTVNELGGKYLLFVLNDRIPDGRDVSWIWDVDFEHLLLDTQHVFVSGDRVWDMSLRLKYAMENQSPILIESGSIINHISEDDLKTAIKSSLSSTPRSETLYILPTYSAMLDVRKILIGKKIL